MAVHGPSRPGGERASPLVLACWSIGGQRAAFFVPADLPAAWIFRVSAPAREDATWSAVRGALMGCVLLPIAIIALLVTALSLGWVVAITHAAFVGAITIVMIEIAALTIASCRLHARTSQVA